MVTRGVMNRTLPLIYAYQDSSTLGATFDRKRAIKLTMEYMTCTTTGTKDDKQKSSSSPVDMLGINVESWCSSTQEYKRNSDGTPGSYYALHEALVNTTVPIIFTEVNTCVLACVIDSNSSLIKIVIHYSLLAEFPFSLTTHKMGCPH